MGNCIRCEKPAGFFRKRHKHCESKYLTGKHLYTEQVASAVRSSIAQPELKNKLSEIQAGHFLSNTESKSLIVSGWESSVHAAFDDGMLTEEEESRLTEVRKMFDLDQDDLDKNGAYTKLIKGGVLRDLMMGKPPDRISIDGTLPFNFQKSEKLIWVFQGVDYYEEKTRREFVGGSQGVSIRIAKGIYYRAGAFKGKSVTHSETVHGGTGMLAVTNKNLYFGGGSGKPFRIRLDKIVSFEEFSDGIGIQRDAAAAKRQSFLTGDGWFTYNLIQNSANL